MYLRYRSMYINDHPCTLMCFHGVRCCYCVSSTLVHFVLTIRTSWVLQSPVLDIRHEDSCQDMDIIDLETMTWMQPNLSGTLPQARNAHTMTASWTKLLIEWKTVAEVLFCGSVLYMYGPLLGTLCDMPRSLAQSCICLVPP